MGSRFTEWGQNKPPVGWQLNAQAVADLGIVFAPLFNEGGGQLLFDPVNGAIGTLGTTAWAAGLFGSAILSTTSTNDITNFPYVATNPAFTIGGQFTLRAWINQQGVVQTSNFAAIISKESGSGASSSYYLGVNPSGTANAIFFGCNAGANEVDTTAILPANGWVCIHGVFTGSGLIVYVNGVKFATGGNSTNPNVNTADINIGRYSGTTSNAFGGLKDAILVANKGWTADQVMADYLAPFYWMQAPKRRSFKSSSVSTPLPFFFDSPSGTGPGAVSIAGLFSPPAVLQKPISPSQRFDPLPELDRSAWQRAVAAPPIPPVVNSPVGAPRSQRIDLEPQHWQWWQQVNQQSLQVIENMPDAPGDLLQLRVFLVNTDG